MGKLHDRMQEDLLLKGYSPHTQKAYLRCARHFVSHYMRSPDQSYSVSCSPPETLYSLSLMSQSQGEQYTILTSRFS